MMKSNKNSSRTKPIVFFPSLNKTVKKLIMKNKTIKTLISILILCMMINQSNPIINTHNYPQIKSSDEEYTHILMEDANETLTFRINSSRDVTAFRLSYQVHLTNGSIGDFQLGGRGDIDGDEILPAGLRIWIISKGNLQFYHNGGNLYEFYMTIYSINPIEADLYYANSIEPQPFLPYDGDPENTDENGDGITDTDINDEAEKNLTWLWVTLSAFIVVFSIYGFTRPKKKVNQSQSNEGKFKGQKIVRNSAEQLERRKARIKTNRRRRNN